MLRVIKCILPIMRQNQRGLILNISSVAALIPIPYQSMYCASKAAIESVSETLRMETAQFGIKVCLVEPGDTKTGFTGSRVNTSATTERSPYHARFKKAINVMIHDETHGPEPLVVAKCISRLISRKNPPVRVAVGFKYKLFTLFRRLVPYRLASFIISKLY
jgi:short-subunit dehydrogenase